MLTLQVYFRGEKSLNPYGREHVVRIRRRLKQNTYCQGKGIYKREQLFLTIPTKFRELVEPFLDKDLTVEAKQQGNTLIIEAKPTERFSSD